MDKSLSFFRVFDIAFFAPGMLLFGVLWYSGCFTTGNLSLNDNTVHEILAGAFAVVFIYVLGLICHGIQRAVLWLIWFGGEKQNDLSWYANLKKDNPRYELIMYFWYMKSTCWNLVVAIVVAIIMCFYQQKISLSLFDIVISIIVIGVLVFLGYEFDKSMRKATR